MGKKFKNLQARVIKIIHHHSEYDKERRFVTILNKKKLKADLVILKCLQGTTIPNFASHGERVSHDYGTRGNKAILHVPRVRTEVAKKSF